MREIFRTAHERIGREAAERQPDLQQMGTTLTVVCVRGDLAWAGQIGDSRLYWIRGDRAWQLTRDHTLAQDLVEQRSPLRAGGGGPLLEPRPDPLPRRLPRRMRRTCSRGPCACCAATGCCWRRDGLVKAVRTETLPELLRGRTAEEAAHALESAALAGGAPDNVTVVLVRVLESREPRRRRRRWPSRTPRHLLWTLE